MPLTEKSRNKVQKEEIKELKGNFQVTSRISIKADRFIQGV